MKVDVLVAEIGSTTTVVNAFKDLDTDNPVFWAQGQAPTSVLDGDVRIGLQGAIDDLCRKMNIDSLEYDEMLATSSAAGGLKMTVHGLVYDMTAKAAKEAALGAGGIIGIFHAQAQNKVLPGIPGCARRILCDVFIEPGCRVHIRRSYPQVM